MTVEMYTLNEKGILQTMEIPIKDAIQIIDRSPYFHGYNGLKFLTIKEWKECSEMDNDQRKLYYELKEN